MARAAKYDILFEPIQVGPKTLKNRFYQTPHCCGFGTENPGAQAFMRGTKAEGGWAVVNTEATWITPESDSAPWVLGTLWSADDVTNLRWMTERVHEHGGLAGVQLSCAGPHHSGLRTRLPARGVSQLSGGRFGAACAEMDKSEIRSVQATYVSAAKLAREAGMDLVQVSGREAGSLPIQFLMPFWNKRTDEYGGTLENRARFWLETLEAVRDAVGDDMAIVAGHTIDTLEHGGKDGIRVGEDGVGFVELADHLVDLWDVQVGPWIDDAGPSRFFEQNWQQSWVAQVRPHTTKPIVGVGRFTDPDVMVSAVVSGQLDIIGAARPSIADPFLPKKLEEGRLDDIRECIGCNMCAARFNEGGRIVCTQNATMGEEYRRGWHPERFSRARNSDKDVLVVGAGPAGMECARVLGMRGMNHVHLVEAAPEIGGVMTWVPRFRGLGQWRRVTDYRKVQFDKLRNVQIIPEVRLTREEVLAYGADIVVVATGSYWSPDGLNPVTHAPLDGVDASTRDRVFTPERLMVLGDEPPGEEIVVYDCEGYFMGASVAELLAEKGKRVRLIAPTPEVAPYTFYTGEGKFLNRRLLELGVELCPNHVVSAVEPGEVIGAHIHAPAHPVTWMADAVVLVTQRISDDSLYRELRSDPQALHDAGIEAVYRVGDCVEPRTIADAVFDGHRLGREIDSPDPETALPMIWERRVLGKTDSDYDALLRIETGIDAIS